MIDYSSLDELQGIVKRLSAVERDRMLHRTNF